jgi:hypothetical protein
VNLQHNKNISPDVISSIVATLQEQKQVTEFELSSCPLISKPDLRRVGLTIELNAQTEGFRKLYYSSAKRFSQLSGTCGAVPLLGNAAAHSATVAATSTSSLVAASANDSITASMLTLDASYVSLTPSSLRLLLEMTDECRVTNVLRGANFKGCYLTDDCLFILCKYDGFYDRTGLGVRTALLALLLDNNQFTLEGLLLLKSFSETLTSLCTITTDGNPAISIQKEKSSKDSSSNNQQQQDNVVITPRTRSAIEEAQDGIEARLYANKERMIKSGAVTEESLLQVFREKTPAASSGGGTGGEGDNKRGTTGQESLDAAGQQKAAASKKTRSHEEELQADKDILGDALADKPKRAPYFRGKYAHLYNE